MFIEHLGVIINLNQVAVICPDFKDQSIAFLSNDPNAGPIAEFIFTDAQDTRRAYKDIVSGLCCNVPMMEV